MCNNYRLKTPPDALFEAFSQLDIPARWAENAAPNLPPLDNIRIRDTAPVVRAAPDGRGVELSILPWAWAGPGGRPVFNFRADGRRFAASDRCLIPADGFFEFTAPIDPSQKRKDRHLFTLAGQPWFWIAGLVRDGAFAMLTIPPGADIAPFHDRQIVVLPPAMGMDWLDLRRPEAEILRALPAGSLDHQAPA